MSMTDSEFRAQADTVFARIERLLDAHGIDYEWRGEVLEIELADGSILVANRHAPNREIWLAARSGGFHFQWRGGNWQDSRDGSELFQKLSILLQLDTR